MKSIDAGTSWVDVNFPAVPIFDPTDPTTLYALGGGTYGQSKSTDGGKTWQDFGPREQFRALVIDPLTPTILYATASQGVLKTTDGGASWTPVLFGNLGWSLAIDPTMPSTLYAYIENVITGPSPLPSFGGVMKTTDAGANWEPTGLSSSLICGDGVKACLEECDDGNRVNGDGCEADCSLPRCGNGIVDAGEECDDGNLNQSDGCTNACSTCGNGVVTPPEVCDDGNRVDTDGCTNDCRLPAATVGDGTATKCTVTAFRAALDRARLVTFNCGPAPVAITAPPYERWGAIAFDTVVDGGGLITLDSGGFIVNRGITFTVENLTIAHGSCPGEICDPYVEGSAILNAGTTFVINSTISGNRDMAIASENGTLTVTNSTLLGSGMAAIRIYRGTLTVTSSSFSDNRNGIINDLGGEAGSVTITNSTFANNDYDGISNSGGMLRVTNSTFSGNGYGISNNATETDGWTVTIHNSTFANNDIGINTYSTRSGTLRDEQHLFR